MMANASVGVKTSTNRIEGGRYENGMRRRSVGERPSVP